MRKISFRSQHQTTQLKLFENFKKPFNGEGVFITIEVEDVHLYYKEIKKKGIDLALYIRDEEWGDRHFALIDPNNIGIDFVTYTKQE